MGQNQPTIDDLLSGKIDLPNIRGLLSNNHIAYGVFGEVKQMVQNGGHKIGENALPEEYSGGKERTFRGNDGIYITLRYLVGGFSDAIGIKLSPGASSGKKSESIYLRRDFLRLKGNYPWVEFFVPRLAHFDEIGEKDIISKPQNNPLPYQQ